MEDFNEVLLKVGITGVIKEQIPKDRFIDGKTIRCHKVGDDCQSEGEYKCHLCRYGWFEVIRSNCKTKRDKYCGIDRCGQKGFPACVRGVNYKSGFCGPGLVLSRDGDKNQVCL
jgi:hypothetical protein